MGIAQRDGCEQKKQRGGGVGCVSSSLLAPHSTIRTPGTQGFLRSSKKHVLCMPPAVNDLVPEKPS